MISHARRLFVAFWAALALSAGAVATLVATPALAQRPIDDNPKYAAIVIQADTGEVLYAKRADDLRYPASITKIMTLYLTFEAIQSGRLKLTDQIVVSPHAAAQQPSKLGVRAGSTVSVEDAIRAICVQSANDMAVAMAEHLGGTESRFTALMTLKARELGMTQTRYVNANGLPDSRQLTTARDIAILSRAMMRDFPQYYPYFSTRYFTYNGKQMHNHNGLLFDMPGVDGIKTGYTNASGFNLAASAVRDNKRLIVVVLGGPSSKLRNTNVEELLDTGFDVLRRRAAGETITVAQGYFEHPSMSTPGGQTYATLATAGMVPSQAPAQVYLPSQATTRTLAATTPITSPAPVKSERLTLAQRRRADEIARQDARYEDEYRDRARHGRHADERADARLKKKEQPKGGYLVQVGSFRQKAEARDWLRDIGRRFDTHLAEAKGMIVTANGWYRTRFMGLTKEAAGNTCRALKAKRLACQVIRA
ncbi:MAG TPA: D-alanyl-D-alanine carboxypeptidase [Caulobacteraceae bacterium]|jgi:D-alanyl-D-alanine carboxypeptidase (penicillin-binding protein 5/6)|nr:D-alanyl-D-alanine carboxypeptidase [Caulobacteraceae bacterium]